MHATFPNKTRIFFPNLDGLRFISFLAVFVYHCYLSFFSYLKQPEPEIYNIFEFLFRYGYLGVNFFFVLSGFLITYLLVKEKELTGKIHVGNFYVRRILRIWPLYFLCLVIGFVIFPLIKKMSGETIQETASAVHYIFFAANFDYMHTWPQKPEAILLSVLWSVAVEEQFYLTWPLLLSFISIRRYRYIFPAVILFSLVFRAFYAHNSEADHAVRYFHTFSLIGDMAVGGLLAYYTSYESRFRHFIGSMGKPLIAIIYLGALSISLLKNHIFPCGFPVIFERLVLALFFGFIIVEQNFSNRSFFKLGKSGLLSKLGTYTYALYCLHLLGMYITVKIVVTLGWREQSLWVALVSSAIALFLSVIISIGSYHLFEKWFLKLKDKFAFIVKQ